MAGLQSDTHNVDIERRGHCRYPTWLPAILWSSRSESETPVRVVDLSQGGAAVEGAFRAPLSGDLKLRIEWFGVMLTLDCDGVLWSLDDIPPKVRLQFRDVTNTQSVLLTALLAAMAAEVATDPVTRPPRRGWLRAITGRGSI